MTRIAVLDDGQGVARDSADWHPLEARAEVLVEAVTAGRLVAALDVFDREPLPVDHPLRRAPHTVLTPPIGYGVAETWSEFYPQSVENTLAFLDGKPIRTVGA